MKKYVTLMIVSLILGASAHAETGPEKGKIDCKTLIGAKDAGAKTAPNAQADEKDVPANAQDVK